jgi:MFS transporter, DHA1 family, multidrug resistance protein
MLLTCLAWTSRPSIHWAVPLLGVAIFQGGSYHISNGLFTYIPRIYPKYAASLFAANAAARSLLAGAAVLFARPMYLALGIGGGVSLLAGLMCICSVLMYLLYFLGPALRKRSRFVES